MDDVLKLADFGSCRGVYSKQPYTEYISTRWYRWAAEGGMPRWRGAHAHGASWLGAGERQRAGLRCALS